MVVITLNEAENIERCLRSAQEVADEMLVVDSGSTDGTQELAEALGARVEYHPFEGYAQQRRLANKQAKHDCILAIDADEVLDDELRASVLSVKQNWQHNAYELNRLTHYCGRWIRHGAWFPDRKIRLFDRRMGKWLGTNLHESWAPSKDTSLGKLEGLLLHYSYNSVNQHVAQANKFSGLLAEELFARGKRASLLRAHVSGRLRFIRDYLLKGGFRDGAEGYLIARISAHASFLKYAKLNQLHRMAARQHNKKG